LHYAKKKSKAVDAKEGVGGKGWCVLVDWEEGLTFAGREWGWSGGG